jgi:hypothetical protein
MQQYDNQYTQAVAFLASNTRVHFLSTLLLQEKGTDVVTGFLIVFHMSAIAERECLRSPAPAHNKSATRTVRRHTNSVNKNNMKAAERYRNFLSNANAARDSNRLLVLINLRATNGRGNNKCTGKDKLRK